MPLQYKQGMSVSHHKSCVKSTIRPQSLLQHFIISIICILQLESCHLAGLIGGRAWGAMSLCLWETCCMLYLCFLNNFQHSMMPSFTSMVYLWTLCFFPFIVMLHAFNCSVYFNNIILPCKVISLVCLHFYVHRQIQTSKYMCIQILHVFQLQRQLYH